MAGGGAGVEGGRGNIVPPCLQVLVCGTHNTLEGSLEQTIPVVGFSHSSKRTDDNRSWFASANAVVMWGTCHSREGHL